MLRPGLSIVLASRRRVEPSSGIVSGVRFVGDERSVETVGIDGPTF